MPSRVVMMCGLAGSGKTTYARTLVAKGYLRLSIDEYIHEHYGTFGVDYDEPQWIEYQREADLDIRQRLSELIRSGNDVVIDLSFWNRVSRDDYKRLVESLGGTWELIYMRVDPAILPNRLALRRQRADANAFPVDSATLARFIAGFEEPNGEGELVIESS